MQETLDKFNQLQSLFELIDNQELQNELCDYIKNELDIMIEQVTLIAEIED